MNIKIKDLINYSNYRNNVSNDYIEEHPDAPLVTIKNLEAKTIQMKVEDVACKFVIQAIIDLRLKVEDAIDEDLIFRKIRQISKAFFKIQKRRLVGDDYHGPYPKQFNNEDLSDGLQIFLHNAKLYKKVHAQECLAYRRTDSDKFVELVKAWTGAANSVSANIIRHFVWQAKRKLFDLKVKNHIMPILYGPQSGGKTEAIKQLINAFDSLGLVISCNISQLTDERYLKVLSDHYICFSDEMGHAEKADINSLKNIITAERLNPRVLGKNTAFYISQNCTFIGATNRRVNEMIHDNTGMRRFFEIECLSKMDWDAINSFDYLALIKSVDESNDAGYLTKEVLAEIRQEQEKIVSHDDLYYFLDENSYACTSSREGEFVTNDELFINYSSWCDRNGTKFKHSKHELLKRLKNKGFLAGIKSISGKTYRGVWVSDQKALQLVGAK